VDSEGALAAAKRILGEGEDLANLPICHGKTTGRNTISVNHNGAACSLMGTVVSVRIADVEGEVVAAVRIKLSSSNAIEPFRRLKVTARELGSEIAAEGADAIGAKELKAGSLLDENLKRSGVLEDPNEDRGSWFYPLLSQRAVKFRANGRHGRLGGGACHRGMDAMWTVRMLPMRVGDRHPRGLVRRGSLRLVDQPKSEPSADDEEEQDQQDKAGPILSGHGIWGW